MAESVFFRFLGKKVFNDGGINCRRGVITVSEKRCDRVQFGGRWDTNKIELDIVCHAASREIRRTVDQFDGLPLKKVDL